MEASAAVLKSVQELSGEELSAQRYPLIVVKEVAGEARRGSSRS